MATYSKSEKTRAHIFNVAKNLFVTQGYNGVSTRNIAQAAEVSTGTLYRYFPSKSDILFEIRRSSLDHLHQVADNLPDDMPLIDKICTIINEDVASISTGVDLPRESMLSGPLLDLALASRAESYSTLEQLQEEEGFRTELRSIYAQAIRQTQAAGLFDSEADPELFSQAIAAFYFQALDQVTLNPSLKPSTLIAPKLEVLFKGYVPEKA